MNGTPVTADDVAKRLGLSRWTVARAFRNDASISDSSKRRVLETAKELGYVPDLSASSLASSRSNLVALLIDDFENPHKLLMLEVLTKALQENGWDVLLVNTPTEAHAPRALLAARQRRVDAAVLIGMHFAEAEIAAVLGASRMKKVIVFARASESPDAISICCDDTSAMSAMTDHILGRGYGKPIFVAGPATISTKLLRAETFVARWDEARGSKPTVLRVPKYSPISAYQLLLGHLAGLSADQLPDVLVCENDALAIGAIDAVRGLGLRVPKDIAVTGFDDVSLAAMPSYDLTTYRQPLEAMVDALVSALQGKAEAGMRAPLLGELVVRGSTSRSS